MRLKTIIPDNIRGLLRQARQRLLKKSIEKASNEQGLASLTSQLETIVPDIAEQYSTFEIDDSYIEIKVRSQHAFQVSLLTDVLAEFDEPTIVDIGDSSGTHLQYIKSLFQKSVSCVSVNLDPKAIERIREKGMDAVLSRVEDLHEYDIDADLFLCFQTVEHLMDPCHFLHGLSEKTASKYLVITVPYLKNSRVGLHHIRRGIAEPVYAENTHIFELSPTDWKLIVEHSGWEIVKERIYFQYPRKGFLRLTKPLWKHFDFEGFYGMVVTRNNDWSSKYMDW